MSEHMRQKRLMEIDSLVGSTYLCTGQFFKTAFSRQYRLIFYIKMIGQKIMVKKGVIQKHKQKMMKN